MSVQYLETPGEFKFAGDGGAVEGYASVFGNIDKGGDVVLPGAFQKFTRTREGKVLMLYQHDSHLPIGKADVTPDSKGLHFNGQLVLSDPVAKRAYNHMREGLLDGMSIGYVVLPGGAQHKGDRRELSALHIYELSAVTWGMNPLARIEVVKSAMDCVDVRELEHLIRDRLGLSSRKAKAVATRCWPFVADREDRDVDREDREAEALGAMAAELHKLNVVLTKGR